MASSTARTLGTLVVFALVLVVVLPLFTGIPFVSYASSGSMEPTIGAFDAYVLNPWPGEVGVGDIIVFDSVVRGQPVVHRVVGGDESGWYTKGDANDVVDQFAGEPLVTRDRLRAGVVSLPSGAPVVVPDAGVMLVRLSMEKARLEEKVGGERNLVVGGLVVVAALSAIPAFGGRLPAPRAPTLLSSRSMRAMRRMFPRGILGKHVALVILVVLVASSALAMARSSSEVDVTLIVVEDPRAADGERTAGPGGLANRELSVGSLGMLPTVVLVEPGSAGASVDDASMRLDAWSTGIVDFTMRAQEERGVQRETLLVHRYPNVFGEAATARMHEALPGSPYFALAALCSLALLVWFRALRIHDMPVASWLGLREEWA